MKRLVAAARLLASVVVAIAGQFDRRDVTMLLGLAILASGLGDIPGFEWLARAVPGAILVLAALGLTLARKVAP